MENNTPGTLNNRMYRKPNKNGRTNPHTQTGTRVMMRSDNVSWNHLKTTPVDSSRASSLS